TTILPRLRRLRRVRLDLDGGVEAIAQRILQAQCRNCVGEVESFRKDIGCRLDSEWNCFAAPNESAFYRLLLAFNPLCVFGECKQAPGVFLRRAPVSIPLLAHEIINITVNHAVFGFKPNPGQQAYRLFASSRAETIFVCTERG